MSSDSAYRRADPGAELRRLAADLAVLATVIAVVSLFAISPLTLEHFGFSYMTSGDGALTKFHPAMFIAVAALGLRCLSTRRPLQTAWRVATGDAGVVILVGATLVAAADATVVARTPVTGLGDTFVLAPICFLLLRDLDPTLKRWLALAVAAVLCANALLAIYEFQTHWHLVRIEVPDNATADPTRPDAVFDWRAELAQEWRATALLGHPLVNGLIVGCFIVCLAAPACAWLGALARLLLLALQSVAMFAFGARTSLVLVLVFVLLLAVQQAVDAIGRGARLRPRPIAVALCVLVAGLVAIELLADSGFIDRTIARFSEDNGSAATRLTMFSMFDHIAWTDLLLAPDQETVATWQRLYGLEFGVESSWLGLILNYGLIVTAMLVVGLVAFSRSVVRASGSGALAILVFYFISVSATASMSGKTTTFAILVAMILLFLPRRSAEFWRDDP